MSHREGSWRVYVLNLDFLITSIASLTSAGPIKSDFDLHLLWLIPCQGPMVLHISSQGSIPQGDCFAPPHPSLGEVPFFSALRKPHPSPSWHSPWFLFTHSSTWLLDQYMPLFLDFILNESRHSVSFCSSEELAHGLMDCMCSINIY